MKPTVKETARKINAIIEKYLSRLDPAEADRLNRNALEYVKALQPLPRNPGK